MTWRSVPFGTILEFKERETAGNRQVPVMSITMHHGLIDQGEKFLKRVASKDTSNYNLVLRNELVVGFPIDEGVIGFQTKYDAAAVSPAYGIWRLRDQMEIDIAFIERFLRSDVARQVYSAKMRGTVGRRRTMTNADLAEIRLPLPPLPEQRRIAAILDKADAIRRKRREAVRLAEEFLQSVFLDMFGDPVTNPKGWEKKRLDQCCGFAAGTTLPTGTFFGGQDEGFFLLKVSDLNLPGNEVTIVKAKEWTSETKQSSAQCPSNAIVFPKRGGAIGTNKKRLTQRPAILDPNLMGVFSIVNYIDSLYLYQWFQLFDLKSITSGSSVPQLNKKDLAPLSITIPSRETQETFRKIVLEIFELNKLLDQTTLHSETLFHSLVQRAFRGELTS